MRKVVVAALLGAALTLVGHAGAATFTVYAGEQTRPPTGVPPTATLNSFFPANLKVHRGDRVTIVSKAFHTATYLGKLQHDDLPLFMPAPDGSTYADAPSDAAGSPFYFATLPRFVYNGAAFGPSGSTVINDRKLHNSGVIGKVTYTFPKLGTFTIHCIVHPGMQLAVRVQGRGTTIPGPGAVKGAAAKQIARAWASLAAATVARTPAGANTVVVGLSRPAPGGEATLLGYTPSTITVVAGEQVTFVSGSETEIHDMVWGPLDWLDTFGKATDFLPAGPGSKNQVNPLWVYGSDAATPPSARALGLAGGYTYDGANHGNGVLATQLIDGSAEIPFGDSVAVTFTKPGTYHFICLVHGPDMSGDVVVTPAG